MSPARALRLGLARAAAQLYELPVQVTEVKSTGLGGEEVAAAVVLREGLQATETEIRGFCSERLADFKVPRKVLILEEIPKGATGKLQRIGLAAKLGLG